MGRIGCWPNSIFGGLTINNIRMTVGITPEYRQQVHELLTNSWLDTRRIFKVRDIQPFGWKNRAFRQRCSVDLQDHVTHICCSPYAHNFVMQMGTPLMQFFRPSSPYAYKESPYAYGDWFVTCQQSFLVLKQNFVHARAHSHQKSLSVLHYFDCIILYTHMRTHVKNHHHIALF